MDKLAFINEQMNILAIPYEYGEWTNNEKPNPYYVGEVPSGKTSLQKTVQKKQHSF